MLSHNVYFWLKPDAPEGALEELLRRSREELPRIAGVLAFVAGTPVPTDRPVVDSSYDVALSMQFSSRAALEAYQSDPAHQKFVAECIRPHVARILVYDFD